MIDAAELRGLGLLVELPPRGGKRAATVNANVRRKGGSPRRTSRKEAST
jgi:hypothetical protein